MSRTWYKGRYVCSECYETDGHTADCSLAAPVVTPAHPPIVDANDKPITVGTKVRIGTEHVWTVTHITDCDGDVDDEGRAYGIPPYVEVALDGEPVPDEANEASTETASFRTYWTAEGWWDEDAPYKQDDLEVVEDA